MEHDSSLPYNVTLVLCLALNTALFVQTRFATAICHPQALQRCRKESIVTAREWTGTILHFITDGRKFDFTTLRGKIEILCVASWAVCLDVSIEKNLSRVGLVNLLATDFFFKF
jgi:hypothetical protein